MKRRSLFLLTALILGVASTVSTASAATKADDGLQQRDSIFISSNKHFNPANGVRSGSGTRKDPFVISGWDVHHVENKDTSKHVVIRNNKISSTLVLDWIGGGAHVYNNEVGDLRVNQNVKRTGDMTSGVIAHNKFGIVGQLRHWDGVFEHNTVGDSTSCMDIPFFLCRGVNFDGFNGAKFRNNVVYGYVEVRLHGHHHSSSFDEEHSHYHGTDHDMHGDGMDHTKRFHRVWVTNNTIHSGDYYGLVYTDSNHQGNDRTAASEQNEELNKPHVHTTKVYLNENRIYGSGIEIDIFNATDELHTDTNTGSVQIKGNVIAVQTKEMTSDEVFTVKDGIRVREARDLRLSIVGNKIDGSYPETDETTALREALQSGSGISLENIDKARIRIANNSVKDRTYGVVARNMTASVQWWVHGLKTSGVEKDVHYDNSVSNEPRRK